MQLVHLGAELISGPEKKLKMKKVNGRIVNHCFVKVPLKLYDSFSGVVRLSNITDCFFNVVSL